MSGDTFEGIQRGHIEKVKEVAQRLIIILEEIIDLIHRDREISSESIKIAKEKALSAKKYLKDLKETVLDLGISNADDQVNIYREELQRYGSESIDDAITAWLLSEDKNNITDGLYMACYKIREFIRNLQ
ncbi:hypothetical protein [Clostridium thermarum]|uniref:hypothetical protein n=1 Tax=Clostridium thermarum TaxID=1716543 RepID=UPI0011202512|nr:hypothetical protein [Clostridium thermarum]